MLVKLTWNKENGCIKTNFTLLFILYVMRKINFNQIIVYYLYLLQLRMHISHNAYDLPHKSSSDSHSIKLKPSFVSIGHLVETFTLTHRH